MPDSKYALGDADRFIRFLLDELQPWVRARYPVDEAQETLYGKSLGGLAVLRVLFRSPGAFDAYVAASPSIWWNDRDLLADEPVFSARVRAGEIRARLLLLAAGEEQYRGDDPARRAEADRGRMIDNAAELAARLAPLHSENFPVTFALLADETHVSVSLAALGRALGFALRPTDQR